MNDRKINISKAGSFLNFSDKKIYSSIDNEKRNYLSMEVDRGISNFLHYQKFPGFKFPLWINDSAGGFLKNFRAASVPFLLNNSFRQWLDFTNYFSNDSIYVNSSGMISGPGEAPWSVEFYLLYKNEIFCINQNRALIKGEVEPLSGVPVFTENFPDFSFKEIITGSRSSIDESIVKVSADFKKSPSDAVFFIVVRPYNNTQIGNLFNISFEPADLFVKINDKNHIALAKTPDLLLAGNAKEGDIDFNSPTSKGTVNCSEGMATLAMGYNISSDKFSTSFKISLDKNGNFTPGKFNFESALVEFRKFASMRLENSALLTTPDQEINRLFSLSGLSLLKGTIDSDFSSVEGYRESFFSIYALNMAGFTNESAKKLNRMFPHFKFNKKKVEFETAVKGAYILKSYTSYYLYKRDMEFLQNNFSALKEIGHYIYSFCTEIHSVSSLDKTTLPYVFVKKPCSHDLIVLASAMVDMSYLSRCMGIFGDETKFKNEAERLNAVLRDDFKSKINNAQACEQDYYGLLALPEKTLTAIKSDEYDSILSSVSNNTNYPIFNSIMGIDNNASAMLLIQLLVLNNPRFLEFSKLFFSLMSPLFLTPEFIDPVTGFGCNGKGKSGITPSLYYIIIRNMFFLDREERLEIFPVPDINWFVPGGKISVDASPSRFGIISFSVETGEKDIRLIFNDPPKYLPPDIMINLPFKASIIEGDDFIVKKFTSSSFLINGWPSVIRFKHNHAFAK